MDTYAVKRVDFLGRQDVPILCQSVNGPCPLLAVANVLSLRNQLPLPRHSTEVRAEELMGIVAEKILETASSMARDRSAAEADLRANVNDCLEALHSFNQGVDVNPRFNSPTAFEPTREVAVFDLLGIPLVHGWLVDQQDEEVARCLGSKSYNQVVEMLIAALEPGSKSSRRPSAVDSTSNSQKQQQPSPLGPSQKAAEVDLLGLLDDSDSKGPTTAGTTVNNPASPLDLLGNATSATLQPAVQAEHGNTVVAASSDNAATKQSGTSSDHVQVTLSVNNDAPLTVQLNTSTDDPSGMVQPQTAAERAPTASMVAVTASDLDDLFSGLTVNGQGSKPTPTQAAPTPTPAVQSAQQKLETPTPSSGPSTEKVSAGPNTREALVVKAFLDNNSSQLTMHGISQIAAVMRDLSLAVFFRNNHFNCLFKYEDSLFLLITDHGYLNVPEVVWERLDTVDGDTQLCGPDFLPHTAQSQRPTTQQQGAAVNMEALAGIPPEALVGLSEADAAAIAEAAGAFVPPRDASHDGSAHGRNSRQQSQGGYQPPPMSWSDVGMMHQNAQSLFQPQHHVDADLALAMQLQEEENAAMQRAQQQQQQQQQQQAQAQARAQQQLQQQRMQAQQQQQRAQQAASRPSGLLRPAQQQEDKSSCSIQ